MYFLDPFRSPLFDEAGEGTPGGGLPNEGNPPGEGNPTPDPPAASPPALTVDAIKELLKAERQATLAEVTKQLNGLDAKYQKQQKRHELPVGTPTADQLREQERQEWQERLAALEREKEEDKKEAQRIKLESTINSALTGLPWRTDNRGNTEGLDVAYTYYSTKAERDENDTPHIGGIPVAQFIKEDAPRRFKGFHVAREVGGAGAAAGNGRPAGSSPLDKLNKPNLTREESREVQNYLAQALREVQLG